jgi:nitric oxide dioxygenase
MTPEQITLVQDSFAKVAPISDAAAELFYGRLFEIAPDVKPMFSGDITAQGKKLMQALTVVVNGLSNIEQVVPIAQKLAQNHLNYGVEPEHYNVVGEALIWTLEKGLADSFTEEVKDAWLVAYTTLSNVMIEAAYPKTAAE